MGHKPRRYAEGTTVDAGKSRGEIDTFLTRQGATEYMTSVTATLLVNALHQLAEHDARKHIPATGWQDRVLAAIAAQETP